ncbi:hypothetical protein L1887_51607 [Cichorium endivia]|nr:hypothetical protein L1887_51607 [Cichorium endivia]
MDSFCWRGLASSIGASDCMHARIRCATPTSSTPHGSGGCGVHPLRGMKHVPRVRISLTRTMEVDPSPSFALASSIVDTLVPIACNRLPPVACLARYRPGTTVPNSLLWSPQRQARFLQSSAVSLIELCHQVRLHAHFKSVRGPRMLGKEGRDAKEHFGKQGATGELAWRKRVERMLVLSHEDLSKVEWDDVGGHASRTRDFALDHVVAMNIQRRVLGVVDLGDAIGVIERVVLTHLALDSKECLDSASFRCERVGRVLHTMRGGAMPDVRCRAYPPSGTATT